jgi:hypothetical protein
MLRAGSITLGWRCTRTRELRLARRPGSITLQWDVWPAFCCCGLFAAGSITLMRKVQHSRGCSACSRAGSLHSRPMKEHFGRVAALLAGRDRLHSISRPASRVPCCGLLASRIGYIPSFPHYSLRLRLLRGPDRLHYTHFCAVCRRALRRARGPGVDYKCATASAVSIRSCGLLAAGIDNTLVGGPKAPHSLRLLACRDRLHSTVDCRLLRLECGLSRAGIDLHIASGNPHDAIWLLLARGRDRYTGCVIVDPPGLVAACSPAGIDYTSHQRSKPNVAVAACSRPDRLHSAPARLTQSPCGLLAGRDHYTRPPQQKRSLRCGLLAGRMITLA